MKRKPVALALAAVAMLLAAAPVFAWPPWLSIEYPVNPMEAGARGALLLVHAYHHDPGVWLPVTCVAEGLVDGQRRSVPLTLERTSHTSVYALKERPPVKGTWMLVITTTEGGATALVDLGDQGDVVRVRVPTQSGQPWPRAVAREEIDASLRQRAGL